MYCHLALRVWTKVGHQLALLAYLGESGHQQMCNVERDRHEAVGLVGGISEHHSLVAGSLFLFLLAIHSAVDVATLFVDSAEDTTRVAVELIFGFCVSYTFYCIAGNGLQVDIYPAAHFAHYHYLAGGNK